MNPLNIINNYNSVESPIMMYQQYVIIFQGIARTCIRPVLGPGQNLGGVGW